MNENESLCISKDNFWYYSKKMKQLRQKMIKKELENQEKELEKCNCINCGLNIPYVIQKQSLNTKTEDMEKDNFILHLFNLSNCHTVLRMFSEGLKIDTIDIQRPILRTKNIHIIKGIDEICDKLRLLNHEKQKLFVSLSLKEYEKEIYTIMKGFCSLTCKEIYEK